MQRWRRRTAQELQKHPAVKTKERAKMITKIIEDTVEESFMKERLKKVMKSQ